MGSRRAYLAGLAGVACGGLAGCTTSDDGATAERTTTFPWPAGEVLAVAIDGEPSVEQPVAYPGGDAGNEYVTRALERAAESGDRGRVEVPNATAFEGVTDALRAYPTVPESVEAPGLLVEFEGDYYAVQLIRLE